MTEGVVEPTPAIGEGAQDDAAVGTVEGSARIIDTSPVEITMTKGLGSRHFAGAAISKNTKAIAVVVSQSNGTVRIFQNGEVVLRIEPAVHGAVRRVDLEDLLADALRIERVVLLQEREQRAGEQAHLAELGLDLFETLLEVARPHGGTARIAPGTTPHFLDVGTLHHFIVEHELPERTHRQLLPCTAYAKDEGYLPVAACTPSQSSGGGSSM